MLLARRSVLIGLALAGFVPECAAAAPKLVQVGTVQSVSGACSVLSRGKRRPLTVGSPIFLFDTLATGDNARLHLTLGEATRLVLGERGRVRIDKFLVDHGGDVVLQGGAMLFDRPDDPESGPFNVTTPFGLIAARGTKFFAGPTKGLFGVFVHHGRVTVRNRGGIVSLTDGLGTDMASPRAAPTPAAPWAADRIALAMRMVS